MSPFAKPTKLTNMASYFIIPPSTWNMLLSKLHLT